MIDKKKERPACFGKLDIVFPQTEEGLRSTPESCFPCYYKTECLKQAMESSEGLTVQEEKIDRAYESGIISFLERWSRKKFIQQRIKDEKS
jgi:hypothetical protein